MKILHYSDQTVQNFLELYQQADCLITTGDLTFFDFPGYDEIVNKKPAFGVYGNHDSGQYLERLSITNLHNRVVEFAGLKWGGFQGCFKYKENGIMFTESETENFYRTFPAVDVLLLHVGPYGMLDEVGEPIHQGSQFIRKYVLEKKPQYVFCGHQYSNAEMTSDSTKLFRTFGARLIDIPGIISFASEPELSPKIADTRILRST